MKNRTYHRKPLMDQLRKLAGKHAIRLLNWQFQNARVGLILLAMLIGGSTSVQPVFAISCPDEGRTAFGLGVTCCGADGEAICPTGDACDSDTVFNGAYCQYPVSCPGEGRTAFGSGLTCCGADGEAICPTGDACDSGTVFNGVECVTWPCGSGCMDALTACCGQAGQISCAGTGVDSSGNSCSDCASGTYYNTPDFTCQSIPSCGYGYSTFGNCCGDTNEVICLGEGFNSCGPGLQYDANTATCQAACSYCNAVGVCCGDVGQTSCAGLGGSGCNYECKDGLHYDSSKGTCQPPCSWGQSSVGTCCGDVGQVHCDLLSGYADCNPNLAEGWFTCETPRLVGQLCGPDYPCDTNGYCWLVPNITSSDTNSFGDDLRCVPVIGSIDNGSSLVTNLCAAVYSSDLAQLAKDINGTLNFGVGSGVAVGVSDANEEGVFYTEDGQYGCYSTSCVGFTFDVSIDTYATAGWTDNYDDFAGSAAVESYSIGILESPISFSLNVTFGDNPTEPVQAVSGGLAIGESVDALPITPGFAQCTTTTMLVDQQTITSEMAFLNRNQPPVALCQNVQPASGCGTTAEAASIDAGSYSPNPGVTVTETQNPPGPYPVGITTVTNIVTDSSGLTSTCTAKVTVLDNLTPDTTPPVLSRQGANLTIQAPQSPYLLFTNPIAADNCDPHPVIKSTDTKVSGACIGTYSLTRTWTATDSSGNVSLPVSQKITVVDTTAPVLHGQGPNTTIQCPATPVFTAPTATDNTDPNPTIRSNDVVLPGSCPGSYSVTRTWTAIDCSGNVSAPESQTITVADTTAPVITCSSNIIEDAASAAGANSSFITTATDSCDPSPQVTCSRNSGSLFAIGTNTVTCTATDCSGNQSYCQFTVTVRGPQFISLDVLAQLMALQKIDTKKSDTNQLVNAVKAFTAASNPAAWMDESHFKLKSEGPLFFSQTTLGVQALEKLAASNGALTSVLAPLIAREVLACRILVEVELPVATGKNLAIALSYLAKGDKAIAAGNVSQGITLYGAAWSAAIGNG
ncbi:MAG: HYR domain-containing protein [Verrucomicrobiia bacterium]